MPQTLNKEAEVKLFRESVVSKASPMEIKENHIVMTGTVMGVPDRIGDVIFPGAFSSKVLRTWEKEGWLDRSHSWDGDPLGLPVKAWVETNESGLEILKMECEYHQDEDSQKQKQKTKERLEKGKKVSTSIGFMPDYKSKKVEYFESGSEMIEFIEKNGYDIEKFDVKAIKQLGWCRAVIAVSELFEISACNVGMHRGAKVDLAKQFSESGGDWLKLLMSKLMELSEKEEIESDELDSLKSVQSRISTILAKQTDESGHDANDLDEQILKLQIDILKL